MTTMSAPPTAQTSQNGPIDGNPSANPNALDVGTLSATDFGDLRHKVQEEVGRLEAGTEVTKDAILNLAKVFREQEEMIRVVGERWNKDQDLEGEVRRLKATNKEMWELRHDKEEQLKARISELQEAAEAGQKQKQTYDWKTTELKDEYGRKDQTMKRNYEEARKRDRKELEEKKTQLETDNADKIATLERQAMELEDTITKLQRDLKEKQKELDKERENNKRIQESMSKDIETWKGKYEEIMAKYAAEEHPPEY
jgi:chromosome segregation ATPase